MTARLLLRLVAAVAPAVLLGGGARADFDQAMGYFKVGKYLEAAVQFQGMVDAAPGYDYGQYMLGECLLRMGKPPEAEQHFRIAIQLRRDKPEYRHGLATALKDQRRYVMAVAVLSDPALLPHNPRTAYAYLALRGYLFAALRRWADAAGDLQRALTIKRDPMLLELLGKAYFSLGRYDRAAEAFAAATEGGPADAQPVRLLTESLLQMAAGTPDSARKKTLYGSAMETAENLRQLTPDDPEAMSVLGRAALGAGQYTVAEGAFRTVLATRPGACHALVNLSRAVLAQNRVGEAEQILDDAARCAPAMPEVHEGLGRVYFRQQRFSLALEAFRRANEIQPSLAARSGIEAVQAKLSRRGD